MTEKQTEPAQAEGVEPIIEKPVYYGRMGRSFGIMREYAENHRYNQEHAAEIEAQKARLGDGYEERVRQSREAGRAGRER